MLPKTGIDRSYLTSHDLGMDREDIRPSIASHVEYTLGKDEFSVTDRDFFTSLAYAVRDRLCDRWNKTQQRTFRTAAKRVYYLSMEYLLGRLLGNAMLNLGVADASHDALEQLGVDMNAI